MSPQHAQVVSGSINRLLSHMTASDMNNTHISIPLGITIGLLASFVQSLGLTVQRKSHLLNQQLPEYLQRVEHRRPLWLLGFAIFISSNVLGSFIQIASLPVVILAPLGAVSLLWNAFFARFLLGGVFSPWIILGTLLITGGAVLIAVFGIVPEPTHSLEDLLELFNRPTFVAYFSLLGAVVFICLAITHVAEYSFSRKSAEKLSVPSSPVLTSTSVTLHLPTNPSALTPNIADAVIPTERTPLLDSKSSYTTSSPSSLSLSQMDAYDPAAQSMNRTRLILAISYASFSGILSGMCLLFAKSGVELLLLTLRGQNQFWRWQAWLLVLGLVAFALLQLWYLHKALIFADPTLVCPSAFCFYNLSSIVNGLVYFDQFSLIPRVHLILVIVGIVVLLGGVWVVSIQSGGGGVDVGAWSDENDVAQVVDMGMSVTDVEEAEGHTALVTENESAIGIGEGRTVVCPDPTERMRSEANVPTLPTSPKASGLELDLGYDHSLSPKSTVSQPVPQLHSPLLPGRQLQASDSHAKTISLYASPRHPSSRQQPAIDPYYHSSSQYHSRTGTTSHGHAHSPSTYSAHPPPLLPPSLNTVATLSAGFQIGLSPVSPGFAIIPRVRKRGTSGVGAGIGFSDVVDDATGMRERELERQRRRTVSEGDARGMTLNFAQVQGFRLDGQPRAGAASSEERAGEVIAGDSLPRSDDDNEGVPGKGKGTDGQGKPRWNWLRQVFVRKRRGF